MKTPPGQIRIECDGRVYFVPDYSIPGMVEQVRREVLEAELLASSLPFNSSTMLYLVTHQRDGPDDG